MTHLDVLIVGAGLSGICAAHYLRQRCPGHTFRIVEARDRLGGTWDLFRYPGVRSDSDMYTLGFSFRPWRDAKAIADGPAILAYLEETAHAEGLDDRISFGVSVEAVRWSSAEVRWTVEARRVGTGEAVQFTCGFLWVCAGYFRYDQGYAPPFRDRHLFGGPVVHPQQWPAELDVAGKRVAIIGSGATAVTLAPALAARGATVALVQRTPTYVVSRPSVDAVAEVVKAVLPPMMAHPLVRLKNQVMAGTFYRFCRQFPGAARSVIRAGTRRELGPDFDIDLHFRPPYAPWDQRLCLVPDSDLFLAIRSGQVSVITDTVAGYTPSGLALGSGREVEADIVVTATGLALQFLGGARMEVDGEPVDAPAVRVYRGCMLSDVPNAAFVLGYTNASWTLKCELSCDYVGRVLAHLRDHGYTTCTPRRGADDDANRPVIEMTSGYFQRATAHLPTQGSRHPWRFYQSWFRDRVSYAARVDDGVLVLGREKGPA